MVTFFKNTALIEDIAEDTDREGAVATNAPRPLSSGSASASSSSGDSGSNATSTTTNSSNSSLSPTAIPKMRSGFRTNWDSYVGESWVLPSGLSLDDPLQQHVLGLNYEATLHSFIISDIEEDKEQLMSVLTRTRDDDAWMPTPAEALFVDRYSQPPIALKEMFKKGYINVSTEALKDGEAGMLDEDFCDTIHHIVDRYHRIYKRNLWRLPSGKSEAWYRENIWWILGDLFNEPEATIYEPGEYHSKASSQRKNRKRKSANEPQQVGRKSDGIILRCSPELELGAMEAAKSDGGTHSTKALSDIIKLAKVMKDQFDRVQQSAVDDVQEQLTTYGIRTAGGSVFFYTMQHRRGRWYQFTYQGSASFPEVWKQDGGNTNKLLSVISFLFAFKRQVCTMSASIEQWTNPRYNLPKPAGSSDRAIPATLTTPTSSPRLASATAPPPLDV
ncbi:MAG: hypothetical protein J3Q66DRAFT_382422 [Benniella sp.]|nr:MAG: hypothetical protein J3Q66DRAFT_382422 [Benniella sp.]